MATKLDHRTLLSLKEPCEITDPLTKGLKLRVTASKSGGSVVKSWAYRYQPPGTTNRTYIGLGSFPTVGIAEARERAQACAQDIRSGVDPKKSRSNQKSLLAAAADNSGLFKNIAKDFWATHSPSWKNAKHKAQWWDSWMETYTLPIIGKMNVAEIKLDDVVKVLKPIWLKKCDTAQKIRGAIGSVLDYAVAHRLRSEDVNNPCKQLKQLEARLGKQKPQTRHQPALDYNQLPSFYQDLKSAIVLCKRPASLLALEFAVLSGLRANCVATLRFEEIDESGTHILIPASKMKRGKPFALPLTKRLSEIIKLRKSASRNKELVFDLSDGAILEALKAICNVKGISPKSSAYKPKYIDPVTKDRITVHGFRATLVSWAEDHGYPRELCEATIQHTKGDSNILAYARGDQFILRRQLLDAYWNFSQGTKESVL